MATQMNESSAPPRNLWRSTRAVLLGFIMVVVLSLATDQVMHMLDVYPPWGEPMYDTDDCLLALAYRTVYAIFGSYLTARFAPRNPMRHAMVGGAIGVVLSTLGAIAAITAELGATWYPIALVLTALPCAWVGGIIYRALHRA